MHIDSQAEIDLRFHGDEELAEGLVDFAVNVRLAQPPAELLECLTASLRSLATYPDASVATAAIAARHEREPDEVLVTAGAAEAFVLLARVLQPARAVVVHPQFTEPEAALLAAGHKVERLLLRPEDGFRLDPSDVPDDADLVMIGNPTNPTSVLHPAADLRALARPGRTLVVDEAFMDAVLGESESLAAEARLPGLVVVRSLTKTWALAGLRIGYLLAEPALVRALAQAQPLWSVSTPALAAARWCSAPAALAAAARMAAECTIDREHLQRRLTRLDEVTVAGTPRAPFVLVSTDDAEATRHGLREAGFAVRRADTFPGLGSRWLRIAVRDRNTTDALIDAWQACPGQHGAGGPSRGQWTDAPRGGRGTMEEAR